MTTIIAISGSIRLASFNQRLLAAATAEMEAAGATIDLVEAEAMDVPIYNGDLQDADGIPAEVADLHRRISAAQGVAIASPEYNGAFSPLLKNTIDWVTRVEMGVFRPHLIGLLATSPGPRGAVHGMGLLAQMLAYMRLTVHEPHYSLPSASDAFIDGGLVEVEADRLRSWVAGYVPAVQARAQLLAADGAA